MKNQALFSSKDKSKILKCRLLQFLFGALRVKYHYGYIAGLICATYAQIEDACSPNQYLECVDEANCTIINEAGDWECVCTEGNGDGLRNGTGCGCKDTSLLHARD